MADLSTETSEPTTSELSRKRNDNEDLQNFLQSFDEHQNLMESILQEKCSLQKQVETLSVEKQKSKQKNDELQTQINNLQSVLDATHNNLHRICDLETENRKIKSDCENLKENKKSLETQMNENKKTHLKEIEEIKRENENEKAKVVDEMNVVMEKEKNTHKKEIHQKNFEIENLKEKIKEREKEAEAEIMRISMEYENKIIKLKQKIPNASAGGSSTNQEIFRMKLQHMKNEHDRELRLLHEKIRELEESRSVQTAQPGSKVSFTSNKKRRF